MVRLEFAKTSTRVLAFANPRVWGLAGPTKTTTERVGVARPVKTRTVRLGFTKMGTRVLAFANPKVGGWLGYKNEGGEGGGGRVRTVRLKFAKTSTQVLDFANPRVVGG